MSELSEIPEEGEIRIVEFEGQHGKFVSLVRIYEYTSECTWPRGNKQYKYYGKCDGDHVNSIDEIRSALEKPPILSDEIYL